MRKAAVSGGVVAVPPSMQSLISGSEVKACCERFSIAASKFLSLPALTLTDSPTLPNGVISCKSGGIHPASLTTASGIPGCRSPVRLHLDLLFTRLDADNAKLDPEKEVTYSSHVTRAKRGEDRTHRASALTVRYRFGG